MENPQNILPSLPDEATAVLAALEDAGHEAWLVGGCVRDALLGRPVHDVDVASSARWQEARDAAEAAGFTVHETGVAHGTVTVVAKGKPVEVTTYRVDGPYGDSRHPDTVSFTSSIDEDLARRDFTVNALAFHPTRGLRDPYGGQRDIAARILRAVGEPRVRFSEDALRIVRAVRFASVLGFSIDHDTLAGAEASTDLLGRIAVERIATEVTRLVCGEHAGRALMDYPSIVDAALPELAPMRSFDQRSPHHAYDVYDHTSRVVDFCPADPVVRWAALTHDMGKPATFTTDGNGRGHFYGHAKRGAQMAERLLARLHMPNDLSRDVVTLVRLHDTHRRPSVSEAKRLLNRLEGRSDLFRKLCALQVADALAHAPGHTERADAAKKMEACLDEVLTSGEAFSRSQLAVTGSDLISAGIAQGPKIGESLARCLDAVIDGRVPNEKDALLTFATEEMLNERKDSGGGE